MEMYDICARKPFAVSLLPFAPHPSPATDSLDGVGYTGAALTGVLSGWLTDAWRWDAAFYLWIAASAGVLMLLLWNYFMSRRRGNMSKILNHR